MNIHSEVPPVLSYERGKTENMNPVNSGDVIYVDSFTPTAPTMMSDASGVMGRTKLELLLTLLHETERMRAGLMLPSLFGSPLARLSGISVFARHADDRDRLGSTDRSQWCDLDLPSAWDEEFSVDVETGDLRDVKEVHSRGRPVCAR